MVRPLKYIHRYWARFDDEGAAMLEEEAKIMGVKPGECLRIMAMHQLKVLHEARKGNG